MNTRLFPRPLLRVALIVPLVLLAGCTSTLTVQLGGVGSGTVSGAPAGISCSGGGGACSQTVDNGTSISLTATASAGSAFGGWGGACSGTNPACTVMMNGNKSAVAYFRTTQVATGAFHTCAMKVDGTVKCWGRNNEGQLGRGTTQNVNNDFPAAVTFAGSVVAIAAGAYHSCALLAGGTIQCWGRNDELQVGDASGASPISAPTNTRSFATVPALGIAAGGYHSCALMSDGTVMCWGDNRYKQSTTGAYASTHTAQPVTGVTGATAVTAGAYHTCALVGGGGAVCWGYNNDGQTGTTASSSNTVAISATQIDAATGAGMNGLANFGGWHSCAVLTTGAVSCWGFNGFGALGNGSTGPTPLGVPITASLVGVASAVASGGFHTCAIAAGLVSCWGANDSAQLGRAAIGGSMPIPGVVVGALPPAVSVDAGGYHTCAVFSGGTDDVRCWGRNIEGQVGRAANNTSVNTVTTPLAPLSF
jgi:alpha-tubulin suppressor-like RCC1 family protein